MKKLLKIRNKIIKLLFKVPFIKYYHVGKELTKNPPRVISNGKDVIGLKFINTRLEVNVPNKDRKVLIKNNHFKLTLKQI